MKNGMKLAVTISGSFQKAIDQIRRDIITFEKLGCVVLSPRMFTSHINEGGFVVLDSDGGRRPAAIHNRHLASIDQSILLWVRNTQGYVGPSTAMEIGYAYAKGVPIYASDIAIDTSLNRFIRKVKDPREALESALGEAAVNTNNLQGEIGKLVALMSAECGFDNETDKEIICLLEGELGELKEAIAENKYAENERHGVAEEMADCAIYLYHLANQSGIDLDRAIEKKVDYNITRWGRKFGTA